MINKVVSFDFDKTLVYSPEPEEGREIWLDRTGEQFPHTGWWGRPESLNTDVFYIDINPWVYKKYLEAIADETAYVILATGRLDRLRHKVQAVLNLHNLSFDEVLCNTGGDTYGFKCRQFERLINKFDPETFIMYDDRHEHIVRFRDEWARRQPCEIQIIDVTKTDKTPMIINPN